MAENDDPRPGGIEIATLRALHDYWLGRRRGGGGWPSRADIDPVDIPSILPHILLVDVLPEGPRFRFRLVGTQVAVGKDPTGQFLHEAAPSGLYGHHLGAIYARAVREAKPFYTVFDYGYAASRGPERIHRLFLPLSDDSEAINMLIVGQVAESNRRIQSTVWQHPPATFRERLTLVLDPDASDRDV